MLKVIYQRAKLSRITLWRQSDEFKTALVSCGEGPDKGTPVPLPRIPRYLLSALPGAMLGPELLSIVALTITILDLKEKHDRLAQQVFTSTSAAKTDTLTGLLSRRAFDLDLDAVAASGHAFEVGLIDLDGFKAINDRPGHALDDTLLHGYGCWLTRVLGPWGQVYRMGGDEYVLLVTAFPGLPDHFAAWARERLQILFVDGVSASIGVAWRRR